jgi:chitin disaccharide deacetylase
MSAAAAKAVALVSRMSNCAIYFIIQSILQKYLIITADDFGLHESVNEAVEIAVHYGVLTTASLMVGAPAAADAVERAQRLPRLRVGLHLVLADGNPTLPSWQIPSLVNSEGRFGNRMAYDGARYFLLPRVRAQLESEIRAQFTAFAKTGLELDHVNCHKHFHLHPTVLEMIVRIGRDFGSPPIRGTREPLWFAFRNGVGAGFASLFLKPWVALLARRLRRAKIAQNDSIFGMAASGGMDEVALLQILSKLPAGVTEIYLHPAKLSGSDISSSMPGYRHRDELAALLSSRVGLAIMASGATLGGFKDIFNKTA